MLSSPRPLIYCFEELSRRATNPEGGFPSRAQPPRTLRRPSGAGEGEAACRGRCGGGPPPPQTNRSSAAPDWIGLRVLARAEAVLAFRQRPPLFRRQPPEFLGDRGVHRQRRPEDVPGDGQFLGVEEEVLHAELREELLGRFRPAITEVAGEGAADLGEEVP